MPKHIRKSSTRREEVAEEPTVKRYQAPAKTIESREDQIIRLAYDEAEKRVRKGTATSQELSHFLKEGSTRAQLEKEKLRKENLLLEAKADELKSRKRIEELYADAMKMMRKYQGVEEEIEDDEED